MTEQEQVRQAVVGRLLSPTAVDRYAKTCQLSPMAAREALVASLDGQGATPYLVLPKALVYLVGGRVLADLDDNGNPLEVTNLNELENLTRDLAGPGVSGRNLSLRHYLGLMLGWQRREDEEELEGQTRTLSYLYHRQLGWSVGWSRPLTPTFPPWEQDEVVLGYLLRWLYQLGVLSSVEASAQLVGLRHLQGSQALHESLPYWLVRLGSHSLQIRVAPWVTTRHQAITQALGVDLERHLPLAAMTAGSDMARIAASSLPPLLHDATSHPSYLELRGDWHELMRTCPCGSHKPQLACCTHLGSGDDEAEQAAYDYVFTSLRSEG